MLTELLFPWITYLYSDSIHEDIYLHILFFSPSIENKNEKQSVCVVYKQQKNVGSENRVATVAAASKDNRFRRHFLSFRLKSSCEWKKEPKQRSRRSKKHTSTSYLVRGWLNSSTFLLAIFRNYPHTTPLEGYSHDSSLFQITNQITPKLSPLVAVEISTIGAPGTEKSR